MHRSPLLLALLALNACSSASFESAPTEDGSTDDTSASDGSVIDSGNETPGIDTSIDAPPAPCDPTEKPADGSVYVSGTGSDSTGDGSAGAPTKTIAKAISIARASGSSNVVLEMGTYPESLRIADAATELRIDGGWKRTGLVWTRSCEPKVRSLTAITSPDAIAVIGEGTKKRTGLSHLSVLTKPNGAPGESLIGVLLRGPDSIFFLEDVAIQVGKAGAGATAATTPTTLAPACDGYTACTATGAEGLGGKSGAAGPAGTFTKDGYVAVDGAPGDKGTNGTNGSAGGPGSSMDNCNWGCSGSGGCDSSKLTTSASKAGKCGCGGIGGAGGASGHGGGASVGALIVGKNATLSIKFAALVAADGGAGSHGGTGATPSAATAGSVGDPSYCHKGGCTGTISACYYADGPTGTLIPGGTAGGAGKGGGKGGEGGGGAGGPSYGVVTVGGATLAADSASVLVPGTPGTGASGAPAGGAGAKLDQP